MKIVHVLLVSLMIVIEDFRPFHNEKWELPTFVVLVQDACQSGSIIEQYVIYSPPLERVSLMS